MGGGGGQKKGKTHLPRSQVRQNLGILISLSTEISLISIMSMYLLCLVRRNPDN